MASLYLALACRLQIRWAYFAIVLHILNNEQTPWFGLENIANAKDGQEIQVRSVKEYRCPLAEDYSPSVRVSDHSWDILGKIVVPEGDPGGL